MTTTAGWRLITALSLTLMLPAMSLRAGEDRPEAARAEMRELEEKAARLKAEGKRDEAKAVMRETEELRERSKGREREVAKGEREGGGDERVAHVRQAMEHLRVAGMGDLAERVGQEAKRRIEADRNPEVRRDGSRAELEQLRAEVQELRQHVRKLNADIEQSGSRR
jgi:hypothetical protein